MARWAMVALLWCAVGADEYGGGSMPQYAASADYAAVPLAHGGGGPAVALDDYRTHSADAPAPLDYKYEEESQEIAKKPSKNNIDVETWKKPAKKHRGLRYNKGESPVEADAEPLPKTKSSRRRYPRHRSRIKSDKSHADDDEPEHRRRSRYGRSHDDDFPNFPADYSGKDKSDYRDDNSQITEDDIDAFPRRETTERIIRRKPRARTFNMNPLVKADVDLETERELMPDRNLKHEKAMEYEDESQRWRKIGAKERYRPVSGEEEDEVSGSKSRPRRPLKHDPDYDDYYDMRRVNDIQSKIPSLLRRTTTRAAVWTTSDLLSLLLTAGRRSGARVPLPAEVVRPTQKTTTETITERTTETTTTTTTTITTRAPASQTTTTTKPTELSIAEKSRLSILKKVQKKDKIRGEPTSKPPVLLQVTNKLPTMVMVEPPTTPNPWLRAKLVSDDDPRKLEKVKRLMRQKVVAEAKSIQDLTDNWDEIVCDYIDVSLLEINGHQMTRPKCIPLVVVFAIHGFLF